MVLGVASYYVSASSSKLNSSSSGTIVESNMKIKTFIKTKWGNIIPLPPQCPICGHEMDILGVSVGQKEEYRKLISIANFAYKCSICNTKVEVNDSVIACKYRVIEES